MYTEARLDSEITESMDILLRPVEFDETKS
jgi:hypothetical protein